MIVDKIVTVQKELKTEGLRLLTAEEFQKYQDRISSVSRNPNDHWWLDTPTDKKYGEALCMMVVGNPIVKLYDFGNPIDELSGVRPVLQISDIADFKPNDRFYFGGKTWTVLSDDLALCDDLIGKKPFHGLLKHRDCERLDSFHDLTFSEDFDIKVYLDNMYQIYIERSVGSKEQTEDELDEQFEEEADERE